jgi:hypothetical protein
VARVGFLDDFSREVSELSIRVLTCATQKGEHIGLVDPPARHEYSHRRADCARRAQRLLHLQRALFADDAIGLQLGNHLSVDLFARIYVVGSDFGDVGASYELVNVGSVMRHLTAHVVDLTLKVGILSVLIFHGFSMCGAAISLLEQATRICRARYPWR